MNNQIEISNQNVCVEKNESIANEDTYVCDVTAVRSFSYFDKNEKFDDIINQGLAIVENSYSVDCVHDDVANVSKHEVVISGSQSCTNEEVESYVSNDEFDVADPTFHGEITQDEECNVHLSQSQLEEQNIESDHINYNDEGSDDEISSYESDAIGEKERTDGSEHSYESEDMIYFYESESENASQFLHYTNQLVDEEFKSDFSSSYEEKEMVNPIDDNEFEYEDFKEGLSGVFTLDNKVSTCSKGFGKILDTP